MERQAAAPAEAPAISRESAREALRGAQSALEGGLRDYAAAKASLDRGRAILASAIQDCERHLATQQRITQARSARLKELIRCGAPAEFNYDPDVSDNAASRAEAESRKAAAEAACTDLTFEADNAARVVNDAKAAVDEAIRQVLREEAEAIAARAESLAAEALRERLKLGGLYGAADQMAGLSAAAIRSIQANAEVEWNSKEFHSLTAAGAVWNALSAALRTDAEARLAFDP